MPDHLRPVRALAVAATLAAAPVAAQETPGPLRLSAGYDGRLYVKVLDVQLEQEVAPGGFASRVRLVSSGALSLFKRLDQRASAIGRFNAAGLPQPAAFEHQNAIRRDSRRVRVRWGADGVSTEATPAYSFLGEPPATAAQKRAAADPLTQLLRMTLADTAPCRGSRRYFDGKQLYDLSFTLAGPRALSSRERRLNLTAPVACAATFREVAGFKKKPEGARNQGLARPITAHFARVGPDGPWVISSLQAQTPLGRATIDLQRLSVNGGR